MQVRESYDLIVIGDQLSGLFLAAGAAEAGKRVLVLEESSVSTVLFEVPSGRFLGDFTTEPVIGLQPDSKLSEFLKELGLYQELDELFPLHDPPLQIVAPKLRLDFSYKYEELRTRLERELSLSAEKKNELGRLLTGVTFSKKTFADLVADISLPVSYEKFGQLQTAAFGAISSKRLPFPAYKEVVDLASRGVRYPVGGRSALKEHLISRILVLGGSLKRNTHVEEIVFERGKLAGVLLSSYEGFVRSQMVVGAMGARTFFHLIPNEFRPKRLIEAVRRIQPRYWRLSFTLLLNEQQIPEGLGSHMIMMDPEGELEGENCLQVQMFGKDQYGGIPMQHRALICRTMLPFEEHSIRSANIARVLKRCLQKLEDVIPFLREGKLIVSPDPNRLESDPVFQKFYTFKSLGHIPPVFIAYDSVMSESFDEPGDLDWAPFGLKGLALCSRDIRPLHGLVGEMMTAMDLLEIMQTEDGKKN